MSTSPVTSDTVRNGSAVGPLAVLYPISLASTNFAAAWMTFAIGELTLSMLLVAVGLLVLLGAASRMAES